MRHPMFQWKSVIALGLVIAVGLAWLGCSSNVKERRSDSSGGSVEITGRDTAAGKYYFFDDILIPKELNYKASKSFVYETPQFKTGSIVFSKFWIDAGSVVDFFVYHMERDNWKLLNSFRGSESIVNFSKPEKTCTIKVVDKWYGSVEVEIRVGPLGTKKM
jgi:hypothetical protein